MPWEAEFTHEFRAWWDGLTTEEQERLTAAVEILEAKGPALGRPLVDRIASSTYQNMKELRVSTGDADLRILFAFGPSRTALLLLGGNKAGNWQKWYEDYVPIADRLFAEYLKELREEGLTP